MLLYKNITEGPPGRFAPRIKPHGVYSQMTPGLVQWTHARVDTGGIQIFNRIITALGGQMYECMMYEFHSFILSQRTKCQLKQRNVSHAVTFLLGAQ